MEMEENVNLARNSIHSSNAVPLPPKPMYTNSCTKRHIRKHPLVINKEDSDSSNTLKIEYENIECRLTVPNDISLIKF